MGAKEFGMMAGLGGALDLALKAVLLSPEGQQMIQPDMVPVVTESLKNLDINGLLTWAGAGAGIGGLLNLGFGQRDNISKHYPSADNVTSDVRSGDGQTWSKNN